MTKMEVDTTMGCRLADPEELPDADRPRGPQGERREKCRFCGVEASGRHILTCVARKHAAAVRRYRKTLELKTAENLLLRQENERLRRELASGGRATV